MPLSAAEAMELDAVEAPTARPGNSATAPAYSYGGSRVGRFLRWYVSCLCPASHEAEPGAHHEDGATGTRRNLLMRFLLAESWTDGSLIALKTDVFAGVTLAVAQVAPSVAFALMGHGEPLVGLYSSFFLGIICCIFGGRPGQITAIAGAVVVLYPALVDKHGYGAACAVSVIAGGFLLLPGVFRFARLVRLLPSSLMLGFCNGLALSMVVNQIPQFKRPDGNFVEGWQAFYTAIICIVTYAVMMLMPYFTSIVPSAFVAIVIGTAIEYIFQMGTVTIGDLYKLHGNFPAPMLPAVKWSDSEAIKDIMVASVLTAIVSAVESFMSGYKIQQLTETPTNFERESLALGAAHIVNGFFQGMPGCVVFGPCILNIECGAGTRRLSSFICAVLMVVIPLALYMVIGVVPMGALSAVLFGVSSKTADWRMLAMIFLQRISLQESVVAIVVTVVTVVSDLAIGAASGLAAALVFFMWNMARGRVRLMPMEHVRPTRAASPTQQQQQQQQRHPALGQPSAQSAATASDATAAPATDAAAVSARMEDDAARAVAAAETSDNCFSVDAAMGAAATEQRPEFPSAPLEVLSTVLVPSAAPSPPLSRSLMGSPHGLDVNFLDVIRDATFPEVKVLRIKLHGVLFFGSCMEFVDGMLKMLHEHHSEIFLKVTDFILDFQHGRMPVLDFSAAEAIQDTAHILAKRAIRTHVQNMDPLSWSCFDRVRRYFPDVCEDDVNNAKHRCYVRRIFKIMPHLEMHHGVGTSGDDELDDNVFLRTNRSLVHSVAAAAASGEEVRKDEAAPNGLAAASQHSEQLVHADTIQRDPQREEACVLLPASRAGVATPADADAEPTALSQSGEPRGSENAESVAVPLTSTEECLPFVDSVKVGLPVYLPYLDITVPIFNTVSRWAERTAADIAAGRTPALEVGLTSAKPLDRQFGDVGRLWWRRLWNRDIPAWVGEGGSPVPSTPNAATAARSPALPLRRAAPATFEQLPRFPGQGYAKGERLRRGEWAAIRAAVCRRVFAAEPPPQRNRVVERLVRAETDLVDGFI
ncbi:Sulfate transporter N-terminal domain with GLY motif/Sulfate transporter family [Novymonas esmeraldas]|uniref:Sulfate transporter N-terminal domain with GLY motif/Sulfate transporter family n=1 Tax=Novymonas esmeraldas TaxID=1808958 RepID=A0AAW0EP93_9TRYP